MHLMLARCQQHNIFFPIILKDTCVYYIFTFTIYYSKSEPLKSRSSNLNTLTFDITLFLLQYLFMHLQMPMRESRTAGGNEAVLSVDA